MSSEMGPIEITEEDSESQKDNKPQPPNFPLDLSAQLSESKDKPKTVSRNSFLETI